ncbi:hypothetical protein BH09PSE5_BH09PSE5_31460 [soil metagenome]
MRASSKSVPPGLWMSAPRSASTRTDPPRCHVGPSVREYANRSPEGIAGRFGAAGRRPALTSEPKAKA